jgi:flagellar biosynthesis chaperone FliJ
MGGQCNIAATVSEPERYRLEPVRDARSREERVRRGELAAASEDARRSQAKVDEAASRVDAARRALDEARATYQAALERGTTSTTLASIEQFIDRRRRELELARDAHARALAAHQGQLASLDTARERLARARADREIIERHFARWQEERRKRAERRED